MRSTFLYGAGGIRTPGTFRHNGFQDRLLKPLGHRSKYAVLPNLIYTRWRLLSRLFIITEFWLQVNIRILDYLCRKQHNNMGQ